MHTASQIRLEMFQSEVGGNVLLPTEDRMSEVTPEQAKAAMGHRQRVSVAELPVETYREIALDDCLA